MIPASPELPGDLPIRVYYEDTDTGGVVYYANYLKFFERARTEWLRSLGVDLQALAARDRLQFIVRQAEVSYRHPARLDDLILIRSRVDHLGASSIRFEQQACLDAQLLVSAGITICAVHAATFKPIRLPPPLRNLLQKAFR